MLRPQAGAQARPRLPSLLSIAAVAFAACAAPLPDGRPCSPADAPAGTPPCDQGRACIAGRCRPAEAPPSPPDATRVVLAPVDFAVVASRGSGGGSAGPPASVALGRAASGTVVLLFRFAATWKEDAEVSSAFVVLDPLEGAPPSMGAVSFEMARIVETWQPSVVSWGRAPRLDVPIVAGQARARASAPIRVDVTPLVRAWARRDAADHGIALLATGDDAFGAVVSTGVAQGTGPRLEVYLK